MKKFFEEFKDFAIKGNVMNLAVGVMIGAAFQGVVTSLTDNILSPIIGLFTSRNFDELQFAFLGVSLRYGAFITSVINFVIVAFVVFLMLKLMSKVDSVVSGPKAEPDPAPPSHRECPYCLTQIPLAATRCPACTSILTKEQTDETGQTAD